LNAYDIVANAIYVVLAGVALWGAYHCVMVWRSVAQRRFRSEDEQNDFLNAVGEPLAQQQFDEVSAMCEGDPRAVSQLVTLAANNRQIGYSKIRQMLMDRFQRDVLADLEYRLSWVNTVIKSAPMVGLLGTVVGMMGAFDKLATATNVKPDQLAENISVALITTACGLSIAIPLIMATASINVRISKMEDLVSAGMTRFLDEFKSAMGG